MKKIILSGAVISTMLIASGCSTSGTNTAGMLTELANILTDATPFLNEGEEWHTYSEQMSKQGLSYATATAADQQFVSKKMDTEYAAAVDRLSRPFARSNKEKKELDKVNQNYGFKYNHIRVVKDKKTSNTIGYCVNYDRTQIDNKKKLEKQFVYIAKDKPISAATAHQDIIKRMCGEDYYKQYKNPED